VAGQVRALSDFIAQGVMDHLGYGEGAISIGFDEIVADDWEDQVVKPDILGKWPSLSKQPGYVDPPA
jgi:4-oxalocrotonate tautomerase